MRLSDIDMILYLIKCDNKKTEEEISIANAKAKMK